ncbi:MAG: hypothetical protein K6A42_05250 [Treponema sp.]|nr:hypothetical protein [Treponema sp.]
MKKRTLLILIAAAVVIVAAGIFITVAVINAKTIKVAFYGLDERVQKAVKGEIDKMNFRRVRYYVLDEEEIISNDYKKKYSILIMKNSLLAKMSEDDFIPMREEIFEALPTSIRNSTLSSSGKSHYALPLLLDHFEIAYYRILQEQLNFEPPQSYGALLRCLEKMKEEIDIPLVCAGANDNNLFAFVSVMSEILYGAEDYKKMLSVVKDNASLNKDNLPEELTRVLDEIKAMQNKELLYPAWTKTSSRDIVYFMQERKIGAVSMYLSDRRKIEYNLIKYYDSNFFPRYNNRVEHGLIAPLISAFLLTKKTNAALVLSRLVSSDVQSELSNMSLLAPVASRAESVDRQADDVRFWAASSAAGALGGIEEECETTGERRHLLAQKIRAYLEN